MLKDYISLTKPRVVSLHIVTAFSAMVLAAGGLPPGVTLLFTLMGGGLVAGASNTFNCYFDRSLDALMPRTRRRPLPGGRLRPRQAIFLGTAAGAAGLLLLSRTGPVPAALAGAALAYYILIYTVWLKRRTGYAAIAGSAAGAFPPLIGWLAVTGRVGLAPFLLSTVILLWTLPHFWALAVFRRNEYEMAGLRALPTRNTARWILVCSILTVACTLLLARVADLGLLYVIGAALLGLGLLSLAVRLIRSGSSTARHLYIFSILYLLAICAAIIADRLAGSVF